MDKSEWVRRVQNVLNRITYYNDPPEVQDHYESEV